MVMVNMWKIVVKGLNIFFSQIYSFFYITFDIPELSIAANTLTDFFYNEKQFMNLPNFTFLWQSRISFATFHNGK